MTVSNLPEANADASNKPEPLTSGQKLVGLEFNPSGRGDVNRSKEICAELADMVFNLQQETTEPYLSNTLKGDAIRHILHAQMAVVKYLTFKY